MNPDHVQLVGDVVAAYVSNNHVAPADLPALIACVHASIGSLGRSGTSEKAEEPSERATSAQVRKSVQPDGLISFIDGKSYKTLKRHLATHGLDQHSYRARFGLPQDYPMVAASYSEKRSTLAKQLGLGKSGTQKAPVVEAAAARKGRRRAS